MIIIKDPSIKLTDSDLLEKLGIVNFSFSGDTTLEECMYPTDKSFNIGEFNNCKIICDDYQLTTLLEVSPKPENLSDYEKSLSDIFSNSEILTVACHSAVNYHLYSLVKNGQKIRYKKVVHGETLVEFGGRIEQEEKIYASSKIIDGQRMFKSSFNDEDIYDNTEDQMMEDFTFGVAARHLGVTISTSDDEELMFETQFRKYL